MGTWKHSEAEADARGFWAGDEAFCADHVSEELLRMLSPGPQQPEQTCVACGGTAEQMIALDELLDLVVGVIRTHWQRAVDSLFRDKESESGWALVDPSDPEDLVHEILDSDVDDELLTIVSAPGRLGEGQWFDPERLWLEGSELIQYSWAAFREWATSQPITVDLVRASVVPGSSETWAEPADGIHPNHMLNRLDTLIDEHVALTEVRKHVWYRAVMVEPGERIDAGRLGSAPSDRAGANRMSPRGVSMFYGADDAPTARAEIRPEPGDRVVTGRWRPARPLKLLDLTRLPAPPSFFDWQRASERDGLRAFAGFADDLSVTVDPTHDREVDYRPTQAFTEYLQRSRPELDGILYRSSMTGGPCCVLFIDNAGCIGADGARPGLELIDASPSE